MASNSLSASIIITCYNYSTYVEKAIDSALEQTYECQVVVVNDGSTDDSAEKINAYRETLIAIHQENAGQLAAFNIGYSLSLGDIVLFLDADDFLYPNAVERVFSKWAPGIASWMWFLDVVDGNGRPTGLTIPSRRPHLNNLSQMTRDKGPGSRVSAPTSGLAWSRSFLEEVMPLPTNIKIAADALLMDAAPFYGSVMVIDSHLGAYRLHSESSTEKQKSIEFDKLELIRDVYDTRRDWLGTRIGEDPGRWLRSNWRQQAVRCLIGKQSERVQPGIAVVAAAGWAVDGPMIKRLAAVIVVCLIRLLPWSLASPLARRTIDFKWM